MPLKQQLPEDYGYWRWNWGSVAFIGFWSLSGYFLLALSMGALILVYGVAKLMRHENAYRFLPGPLVLLDIAVEDAREGWAQWRSRGDYSALRQYGPEIESI